MNKNKENNQLKTELTQMLELTEKEIKEVI